MSCIHGRQISSFNASEFEPPENGDWVFAKDTYVTEGIGGKKRTLSYDEMEQESEGETHRWLRVTTLNSLQELGYSTYDGGVGVKGHNGFCDGAAKRGEGVVLFECLTDWAVSDLEQLNRKLKFSEVTTLILVVLKKSAKTLKTLQRIGRIKLNSNVIIATPSKQNGQWGLSFSPTHSHHVLPEDGPNIQIQLNIVRKRSYSYFTVKEVGDSDFGQLKNAFSTKVRRATFEMIGGFSGATNQRYKGGVGNFEFIARSQGVEIARYSQSYSSLDIEIKTPNEYSDFLKEKVDSLAKEFGICIEESNKVVAHRHIDDI